MSANLRARYFFQQRQRNRLYETVVKELKESGIPRKKIAETLGVSPSQISHWLSGPSNWTVDTVSDFMFAIGSEMDFYPVRMQHKHQGNRAHVLNLIKPQPSKAVSIAPTIKNAENSVQIMQPTFGSRSLSSTTVTISDG